MSGAGSPKRGLVLSGGGARGAYEIGVLQYALKELPSSLWEQARFRVFSGTSVGAINACFLAAFAEQTHLGIDRLADVWRSFRLDKVLRLGIRDLIRLPVQVRDMLHGMELPQGGVMLNSEVLQSLVIRDLSWTSIRHNLRAGLLDAITVSTTHVASGRTVVFADTHTPITGPWSRDPRKEGRAVRLRPAHALASAAIPFIFAPIAIDGAYYCDGGLRQNTPVSPALRLGADRLMVIATRPNGTMSGHGGEPPPSQHEPPPNGIYLLGKLLDALMLDRLEYDLTRVESMNRIIRDGQATFGPQFAERLAKTAAKDRGYELREVKTLVIRPTVDIGAMATEFARQVHPNLGGVPGWLLSKLGHMEAIANTDLMSYLMFDGRFADELIALGMRDADAHRQELIDFLKD